MRLYFESFNLFKLSILMAVIHCALFWKFNNPYEEKSATNNNNDQLQYFDQLLDHYSYLEPTFWKQKYYVRDTYFDHKGPVILILGG